MLIQGGPDDIAGGIDAVGAGRRRGVLGDGGIRVLHGYKIGFSAYLRTRAGGGAGMVGDGRNIGKLKWF